MSTKTGTTLPSEPLVYELVKVSGESFQVGHDTFDSIKAWLGANALIQDATRRVLKKVVGKQKAEGG